MIDLREGQLSWLSSYPGLLELIKLILKSFYVFILT